ncbi:MAG: hypothetical protein Q4A92_02945 [Corynebacterium sp.]|nr:hypothetical protein [Corynebacterium sp.]
MAWFHQRQQEVQLEPVTIERLWEIFEGDPSESVLEDNCIVTGYKGYIATLKIDGPNMMTVALTNPVKNFPRDQIKSTLNWASSRNWLGTVGTCQVSYQPNEDLLIAESYHTFFIQEGATGKQLAEWLIVGFECETEHLNDFCGAFGIEPYFYRDDNT